MKAILDKAEVALEYPDKFYSGTFERSSRFEAAFDSVGVGLVLQHPEMPTCGNPFICISTMGSWPISSPSFLPRLHASPPTNRIVAC